MGSGNTMPSLCPSGPEVEVTAAAANLQVASLLPGVPSALPTPL